MSARTSQSSSASLETLESLEARLCLSATHHVKGHAAHRTAAAVVTAQRHRARASVRSGTAVTITAGTPITVPAGTPVTFSAGTPITVTAGSPLTVTFDAPVTLTFGTPVTVAGSFGTVNTFGVLTTPTQAFPIDLSFGNLLLPNDFVGFPAAFPVGTFGLNPIGMTSVGVVF